VTTAPVISLDASRAAADACLVRYQPRPAARLRLYCFPWSGAGASAYRSWAPAMPADVELIAVQLPGRGGRRAEPASDRLAPVARQVARAIHAELCTSPGPFAIFGHSLGALLAYEVAQRLAALDHHPELIALSGSRVPNRPPVAPLGGLDDADLRGELLRIGGISPTSAADSGFMAYFLPLVRTDLAAAETYQPAVVAPVRSPLSVWAGSEDWYAPATEVARWRYHADGLAYRSRVFPGGHFFTDDRDLAVTALLEDVAWSRRHAGACRVRPMVPADLPALHAMVRRCSPDSRYDRFQSCSTTAAERHVESLFTADRCYSAVVAGPGSEIVGLGSLFFDEAGSAEIALLVADDHQGRGMGTRLAEHLCDHAVRQGTARLEVVALAGNIRIIRLFRRLGDGVRFGRPDAGVVTTTLPLGNHTADRPVQAAA